MQIYTFLRFITRITLKIISDAIKTVRFLNEDIKKYPLWMTVKRNTACPSRRTSIFVKNIKIVKYTFFYCL